MKEFHRFEYVYIYILLFQSPTHQPTNLHAQNNFIPFTPCIMSNDWLPRIAQTVYKQKRLKNEMFNRAQIQLLTWICLSYHLFCINVLERKKTLLTPVCPLRVDTSFQSKMQNRSSISIKTKPHKTTTKPTIILMSKMYFLSISKLYL